MKGGRYVKLNKKDGFKVKEFIKDEKAKEFYDV